MSDDDIIQAPPDVPRDDRLDTDYSPSSERDVEELQQDQAGSPALDDPGIDRRDVRLLPGTGGPDDTGQIHVDSDELHVPRHPDASGVGPVEDQAVTDGGQR